MKKKIFNNDKLTSYDIISVILYLVLTFIVSGMYYITRDIEVQKLIVMSYSFITPILLYLLSYKSLRNIKCVLIWVGFGIYHLILYNSLLNDDNLNYMNGHAANGLQYTIYFVLLFEILRISHFMLFDYELVSPARASRTDLWDERKIRIPDYICFFVYMLTWVIVYLSMSDK